MRQTAYQNDSGDRFLDPAAFIDAVQSTVHENQQEPGNIILMHAVGANVSGQIASVIAGGLVISLVTRFL